MPRDLTDSAPAALGDTTSSHSSTEPVSPRALPTEAELRATDLEAEAPGQDASEDDRESRVRNAAYAAYLRRGSEPGHETEDWLDAEREIDAQEQSARG